MNSKFLFLAYCALLAFVIGCGGSSGGGSPEGTANSWLQALAAGDGVKVDELTCSAQVEPYQNGTLLTNLFGVVGQEIRKPGTKLDISTLKIAPITSDEKSGSVRVTGRIRSGEGIALKSRVIDQMWQLEKEEGAWKFCGRALFKASDLARIVLQPSEVPLPLVQALDGEQALSFFGPELTSGAMSSALRNFGGRGTIGNSYVGSYAIVFDTPSSCLQYLASTKQKLQSFNFVLGSSGIDGLGEESYSSIFKSNVQNITAIHWCSANLYLSVSDGLDLSESSNTPSAPTDDQLRAYVERTLVRLYSNATPEPIPPTMTPVSTNRPTLAAKAAAAFGKAPAERNDLYQAAPPMTIDVTKTYRPIIETSKGNTVVDLFPKDAPQHVNNFVFLARDGFYDGLTFHRVEPGFVIQGGAPLGNGTGGPGYTIPPEIKRTHPKSTLAMARSGGPAATTPSSGSQFYITLDATPNLDGGYTSFGQTTPESMSVVEQIAVGDVIKTITIEEQ